MKQEFPVPVPNILLSISTYNSISYTSGLLYALFIALMKYHFLIQCDYHEKCKIKTEQ